MADPILTLQKSYLLRRSFVLVVFQMILCQMLFGLLIAGLYFIFSEVPLFFIVYPLNPIVLIIIFLRWHYDYYVISMDSLAHTRGIFYRRTETWDFNVVKSVEVVQSFVGMLFGYGTVVLVSPDVQKRVCLDKVQNPYVHARTIDAQRLNLIGGKPPSKITPVIESGGGAS